MHWCPRNGKKNYTGPPASLYGVCVHVQTEIASHSTKYSETAFKQDSIEKELELWFLFHIYGYIYIGHALV